MKDRRIELVLGLYQPPAGAPLWHGGATVLGSLRGVEPEEAAWRPAPDRHSIWALALHVAYWKYAVLRRLVDTEVDPFPRSPSNFPAPPDLPTVAAWKEDRALVRHYHEALGDVMSRVPPARFDRPVPGKKNYTYGDHMSGIVLHDVYHAGQIVMLKRLYVAAGRPGAEAG